MSFKRDWSALGGRAYFFERGVEATFFHVNVIYITQNNMAEARVHTHLKEAGRSRLPPEDTYLPFFIAFTHKRLIGGSVLG